MAKPTIQQVILSWAYQRYCAGRLMFHSHDVEWELPQFGLEQYRIMANPATYSREFRKLRQGVNTVLPNGLWFKETGDKKEKQWTISLAL